MLADRRSMTDERLARFPDGVRDPLFVQTLRGEESGLPGIHFWNLPAFNYSEHLRTGWSP